MVTSSSMIDNPRLALRERRGPRVRNGERFIIWIPDRRGAVACVLPVSFRKVLCPFQHAMSSVLTICPSCPARQAGLRVMTRPLLTPRFRARARVVGVEFDRLLERGGP